MLKEGSTVIITGKLDESVRENKEDVVTGTVTYVKAGKVWVLLKDGTVWIGNDWEVYEEQRSSDV